MNKPVLTKDEAIDVVIKQIQDYDAWAYDLLNCLMSLEDKCTHPYLGWINQEKFPEKAFCMLCHKDLHPKEASSTFRAFDSQIKVNEAIAILKLMKKDGGNNNDS